MDSPPNRSEAAAAHGVPIKGLDEGPGDSLAERRSADADRPPRKRRRGRTRKGWIIHVKAIDPKKYPELERNPENPYSYLDPEKRMEAIVSFCARLWARTCQDIARRQLASKDAEGKLPQSSPTDPSPPVASQP